MVTAFAAEPGILASAEGRFRGAGRAVVGADDAKVQRLRHPQQTIHTLRHHIASQSIGHGVGECDRLRFTVEGSGGHDRAEGLLACAIHGWIAVLKHRRSEETIGEAGNRNSIATNAQARALGDGVADVPLDLLHRRIVDQRTDARVLSHRIADDQHPNPRLKP